MVWVRRTSSDSTTSSQPHHLIRDAIFREVASNILIHREYTNAFPAKLIIEQDLVRSENSSRPHGFGRLDSETFTPFTKNRVIARFFRQIGRADEFGSGVRKMQCNRCCKKSNQRIA